MLLDIEGAYPQESIELAVSEELPGGDKLRPYVARQRFAVGAGLMPAQIFALNSTSLSPGVRRS